MVVAIMGSEHYEWVALGDSKAEAAETIRKEWNKRQREMERSGYKQACIYQSWQELMDWYGIHFYELEKGQCEVL